MTRAFARKTSKCAARSTGPASARRLNARIALRDSLKIHAAVHQVALAGDEARVLAREINHQRYHLLRLAQAADRLRGTQRVGFLECIALYVNRAGPRCCSAGAPPPAVAL